MAAAERRGTVLSQIFSRRLLGIRVCSTSCCFTVSFSSRMSLTRLLSFPKTLYSEPSGLRAVAATHAAQAPLLRAGRCTYPSMQLAQPHALCTTPSPSALTHARFSHLPLVLPEP